MALIVGLIAIACAIVVFGVILRIGAATLRMAVSVTNMMLGGRDPGEDDFRRAGYDYNPTPRPASLAGLLIPMPGVLYAVLINIGVSIASNVAMLGAFYGTIAVLGMSFDVPTEPTDPEALRGVGLAFLAAIAAWPFATVVVLKLALPTTYVRAALVGVFQTVIAFLIFGAIGMGIVLLSGVQISDVPNAKPAGGSGWVR
ncbi:hypothetical protein J0H58_22675 [bacterium]|nr:hypothetical protein [bacterium]